MKPVSTLTDLQVKAYEKRVRERLMAKYPTLTLAEAGRLENQIQKLVQIYAAGRPFLHGDPPVSIRQITMRKALSRPERFKIKSN